MLEWFYNLPFVVTMNQMNLPLLAPELILLIVILFCLFQSIAKSHQERLDTWNTAILGLVLVMMSCLINFFGLYLPDVATGKLDWFNQSVAFGVFQADLFSLVVRFLLVLGTLLTLLLTREYLEKRSKVPAEFYVIMLSALLGAMFMAGASDLIMLFVAIETLGIASYILVGFIRGNLASTEAALKYLLYGAAASGCILFGFSLLYGVSGTTALNGIAQALVTHQLDALLMALSLALVVGGIGFKLSVAPFHNWAPDVYEGAPAPVTAFLSVVSKLAGFAVAIRLLFGVLGPVPGFQPIILGIAIASMVLGNLAALKQTNIKRLLAYSTIAHAGYMLLGLVTLSTIGLSSLLFYLVTYLFMNLGAFGVVIQFQNWTGSETIADYAGLVQKRPGLALIFTTLLLSLSGIPITSGFFAKFFLFQSVAAQGQYLWVVIVALLMSTVSLYYYLNVVRLMVIAPPSEVVAQLPDESAVSRLTPIGLTVAVCLVMTLALGVWSEAMIQFTNTTMQHMTLGTLGGNMLGMVP